MRRRSRLIMCVVVFFISTFVPALLFAQTGSITGRLTDAATGQPLVNSTAASFSVSLANPTGAVIANAPTGANGVYTFPSVAAGTYYLFTLNRSGYVDQTYGGAPYVAGVALGRPLTIAAGQTVQANFALQRGAVVGGRVVDAATGAPVPNTTISLYDARFEAVATGISIPDGSYRIGDSRPGLLGSTYYAVVTSAPSGYIHQMWRSVPCNNECRLVDATPIRVGASQTVGRIDFALQRGGAISGRVTDALTGDAVAGALVVAVLPGAVPRARQTDATGTFLIPDLRPGTYSVVTRRAGTPAYVPQLFNGVPAPQCDEVPSYVTERCAADLRTGTPVNVAAGTTTAGINIALARGGTISGRVTLAGGVPGSVTVYDATGTVVQGASLDSAGNYQVGGLPTGTYFVMASAWLGFPVARLYASIACPGSFDCLPTTGTPVSVVSGSVTSGIDIALPAGRSITGTVVSTAGGAPVQATVWLYSGDYLLNGTTVNAATGAFAFDGVPPGTYDVRASATGYVEEAFNDACVPCGARGTGVTVTEAADVAGIDFQLDPAGKITGVLSIPSSVIIESLHVDALRADGSVVKRGGIVNPGPCSTSLQCAYEIDGLPSGSYFVRARSELVNIHGGFVAGGEFPTELYPDVDCQGDYCPLEDGTPVAVTLGATTSGINMTMERGGTISGRVRAEGGTIPAGTSSLYAPFRSSVQAYTAEGHQVGTLLNISAGSPALTYTINGLRPGTHFLKASGSRSTLFADEAAGYAETIYKDLICPACPPQMGTPVVVRAGEPRRNIDFVLLPGGSIAGRVTDAGTGAPIDNLSVMAYTEGGVAAAHTVTGRLGGYLLSGLAAGRYFVATSNVQGYVDEVYNDVTCGGCDPSRGAPVTVQGGVTTENVNLGLARGTLLSGMVANATGNAIENAVVSLYNSSGAIVARARTNAVGRFAIGAPAGPVFARAEAPGLAVRLYRDLPCPNGTCDPTSGTPIAGGVGDTIRGIDFGLPACTPLLLTTQDLADATMSAPYSQTLAVAGTGPFAYSRISGVLPPGLTLDAASGTIAGTPTTSGQYTFTISASQPSGCSATRTYTIEVITCTTSLARNSFGFATFDVSAAGGVVTELVTGCPGAVGINVPWIQRGRDLGPSNIELNVAPNPGGRRTGTVTIGNRVLTIVQAGAPGRAPFGSFDVPLNGQVVTGSVALGGWALDDLLVSRVAIFRSAVAGEANPFIFLGDAVLVPGARPDVETIYPEFPYANRGGWGYLLLTNMLPNGGNGTFALTAIAQDVEGNQVNLGTRVIVANNAAATRPFGAIDTPRQGETVSGSAYVNFGWALTPRPKTIPRDGSTIQVFIDGARVGGVTYNQFRPDIARLFPLLNNADGAVGYRHLDTTALTDGVHTISWLVSDDAGAAAGIGSRYFTVANADAAAATAVAAAPPSLARAPEIADARQVGVRELERVEVDLSGELPVGCTATITGVERVAGHERPLPVGASLDQDRGTFIWQPGPGFLGTYHLAFDVRQCDGTLKRIDVDVTIERQDQ